MSRLPVMVLLVACRPPGPTTWEGPRAARVVAGTGHACARWADGTAACWGDNRYGQLGTGAALPVEGPVAIALPGGVTDLDAAGQRTCAIDGHQRTWCWGRRPSEGHPRFDAAPRLVEGIGPLSRLWTDEAGGCGLAPDGKRQWCWRGDRAFERNFQEPADALGGGCAVHAGRLSCPAGADGVAPFGDEGSVLEVTGSGDLRCALGGDGRVACGKGWVVEEAGATDVDVEGDAACVVGAGGAIRCREVGGWRDVARVAGAARVAVGEGFVCSAGRDGVACWGDNTSGQLGQRGRTRAAPVDPGLRSIVDLVAGASHTCALDQDGVVSCWGANDRGQVDASGGDVGTPRKVAGVPKAVALAADQDATCALGRDGEVWCWGDGAPPRLAISGASAVGAGCGVIDGRVSCWNGLPDPGLPDARSVRVEGGLACAIREGGAVTCWDAKGVRPVEGASGIVGIDLYVGDGRHWGTDTMRVVSAWDGAGRQWSWWGHSRKVGEGEAWSAPVSDVAFGRDRRCGRLLTGGVHCLDAFAREVHLDLPDLDDVAQLAMGMEHLCVRTNAGEVRCVFDDDRAQLGDAATPLRASAIPVRVPVP